MLSTIKLVGDWRVDLPAQADWFVPALDVAGEVAARLRATSGSTCTHMLSDLARGRTRIRIGQVLISRELLRQGGCEPFNLVGRFAGTAVAAHPPGHSTSCFAIPRLGQDTVDLGFELSNVEVLLS
jgi:hypothetical protein